MKYWGQIDMSDERVILQQKFETRSRYSNFGNMLMRITARGFRCHQNTILDINSPITAICGLNGTGKSTFLQLAAAAYNQSDDNIRHYYLKDFFVVGTLDPRPFSDTASVEYRYCQEDGSKSVTLTRNNQSSRWGGYPRRPPRNVFFASVGMFLPRIEQNDFLIRNAQHLVIQQSNIVENRVKEWTCRILGSAYDCVRDNRVRINDKTGNLLSVNRSNISYSEPHMGWGELRVNKLISMIEMLPEKSLVLIEEPEISLHPSAQHEMGRYLINVACEKGHQIMITTHSEFILESLPIASCVYINNEGDNISTIPGITSLQAKSLMADGHVPALHILVEDNCAKAVLSEMIRSLDYNLLQTVRIHPCGNTDIIQKTMEALSRSGLPIAAVRDGDKQGNNTLNIFKLPGTLPPEKELYNNRAVKDYIQENYYINMDDFATSLLGVDHHQWFTRLAARLNIGENALITEISKVYALSLGLPSINSLIDELKVVIENARVA